MAEGGLRARAPGGARGNPRLAEAGRRGHARRLRNVFRRAAQATHAEEPANRSGGDGCRADSAFQAVERVEAGGPLTGFFLAGRAARWLESILVHPGRTLAVLAVLAAAIAPPVATAQPGRPVADGRPPLISAESVLLLDPEGRTLFAKNPDEERAPASLVKLMTLYLAFEDIEARRADLDELVPVSRYAAVTPRSRMGLRAGESVPLHVLLEGVAIASANDAATALAERLAGDEWSFVGRMNAKAQELELHATRFANPHGLPDPAQRSSARDLAQLIARLLRDHPAARPMLGGQTFVYRGRVYARHIPLFNDPLGVQALKTGFTHEAGYNLAVSAWRDGQQFVMIVLGSRTRTASFLDAKKLLKFGFVEAGLDSPPEPRPPRRPARTRRTTLTQ
ncbi:MAG: hypothetical protein DMD99_26060 [Candidatus Rokuibacteriota bacterium]|nr:MAG: hypothetical protein DMD99_26060 [Candidatus Rokubacteria bacterium]